MLSSSINPEVGNMLLKNIERFLQDYNYIGILDLF